MDLDKFKKKLGGRTGELDLLELGSSVSAVTTLRAGDRGSIPGRGRDGIQTGSGAHPSSYLMGIKLGR